MMLRFRFCSASLDRRSEDVRVLPIVITELELGDIQRHIFAAHFVERADHATLEDRPEAFDGLGMDRADDILASRMVNSRVRVILVERIVALTLIGAKQADPMRHRFADEGGESGGIHVCDNTRNDVTLAADRPDDRRLAGTNTPGSTAAAAFIPMPVFGQAADESFVDFDNSAELIDVLHQRGSDLMAHEPSGFVRTEPHVTIKLQSAHTFLASEHQMNDAIPITKRLIGVFENRSRDNREPIAVRRACPALPMEELVGRRVIEIGIAATRATDAIRPATRNEIRATRGLIGEQFFELCRRKLMDWFWLLCSGHGVLPSDGRRMACLGRFVKSGIFALIRGWRGSARHASLSDMRYRRSYQIEERPLSNPKSFCACLSRRSPDLDTVAMARAYMN